MRKDPERVREREIIEKFRVPPRKKLLHPCPWWTDFPV
jgi:hypothetical protein